MPATALPHALGAAAQALAASAPELNRLDGFAGDGDLGVTMTVVAEVAQEVLAREEADGTRLLSSLGAAIARRAPSTSGTLLATACLRASQALRDDQGAPVEVMLHCFSAALEGVMARGKAEPGDRTLVDGLDAICGSLERSVADGTSWPLALLEAAGAAQAMAEATSNMEPRKGRASWVPQRALGHPDAGCSMLAIGLQAAAQACQPLP